MPHDQTEFLSSEEREAGIRNYQKHSFWNGLGINFINTSIVSLLAIHFGATNVQLGYISAVFHVTGIILIFLPRLLDGLNIKRVFFVSWLSRGLVCYLYLVLLLLDGRRAVAAILALFTLFAALRSIGVPMAQPLQKSLARPSEEGGIVVGLHIRLTVSQLISQVASFLLLSIEYFNGLIGLVVLTTIGAVNNTIASLFINKIPSRETIHYRPGKNVFVLLADTLRHPTRRPIFVSRVLNVASGILFTFGVAFLRRVVGMPANMVFVYMIAGALAALGATLALRPFVDTIGSKPLLIIASFCLAVLAVVWAGIGSSLPWVFYYVLGFLTFFFLRIRLLLLSRLIIKTMPRRDRISYSAMLQFAGAVTGLLVGLSGGALADWSGAATGSVIHMYSYTYLLAAALCFAGVALSLTLRDPGSLTLKEAAAVLLSAKNLRAYMDIYQLDIAGTPEKRESRMLSLEQSDAPVATAELCSRLKSPDVREKERILRSLEAYPRRELIDDIVAEALDENSPNRKDAVRALGSYQSRRARSALRRCIDAPGRDVEAAALYSLARLGDRRSLERIIALLTAADADASARVEAIRGLSLADEEGRFLGRLFELAEPSRGVRYEQSVLTVCLTEPSFVPSLGEYLRSENIAEGSGFESLLADAQELSVFHTARRRLGDMLDAGRTAELWRWCAETLGKLRCAETRIENLRLAVCAGPPLQTSRSTTLACLYLTYQILRFIMRGSS